jgi:predicted component of type VI protein secretion system
LDENNNTNIDAAVALFEKAASANWKTANEVNSTESTSLMKEIVTQCAAITDGACCI